MVVMLIVGCFVFWVVGLVMGRGRRRARGMVAAMGLGVVLLAGAGRTAGAQGEGDAGVIADRYLAAMQRKGYGFLSKEELASRRGEVAALVAKYGRRPLEEGTRAALLEGIDRGIDRLYATSADKIGYGNGFGSGGEEWVYLNDRDYFRTFQYHLWFGLTHEALAPADVERRDKQRQWMRKYLTDLPYRGVQESAPREGMRNEEVRAWALGELEKAFADPLHLLSEPMPDEGFAKLQARFKQFSNGLWNDWHDMEVAALTARFVATKDPTGRYGYVYSGKLPFDDTVVDLWGNGPHLCFASNADFRGNHGSLAAPAAYDVMRCLEMRTTPGPAAGSAAMEAWLGKEGRGELSLEGTTLRAVRGAKMAELAVKNWFEADKLSEEQLRGVVRDGGRERISIKGLPAMNGFHRGDRSEGEFFVVVQTREGRLAVINLHNYEFARVMFWCRPRAAKAGAAGNATRQATQAATQGATGVGTQGTKGDSGANVSLGPVCERMVGDLKGRKDCLLDLDTGELSSVPEGLDLGDMKAVQDFLTTSNADFVGEVERVGGLAIAWRRTAIASTFRVSAELWGADSVPRRELEKLSRAGMGRPNLTLKGSVTNHPTGEQIDREMGLPATYLFDTPQGAVGLLQVMALLENPKRVRVRYRLVGGSVKDAAATRAATGPAAQAATQGATTAGADRAVARVGMEEEAAGWVDLGKERLGVRLFAEDKAPEGMRAIGVGEQEKSLGWPALYQQAVAGKIGAGHQELIGRLGSSYLEGDEFIVGGFIRKGNRLVAQLKYVRGVEKKRADGGYDWRRGYFRAALPGDLPAGRYYVLVELCEYFREGGELIFAPKTDVRAFEYLTCMFDVPGAAGQKVAWQMPGSALSVAAAMKEAGAFAAVCEGGEMQGPFQFADPGSNYKPGVFLAIQKVRVGEVLAGEGKAGEVELVYRWTDTEGRQEACVGKGEKVIWILGQPSGKGANASAGIKALADTAENRKAVKEGGAAGK